MEIKTNRMMPRILLILIMAQLTLSGQINGDEFLKQASVDFAVPDAPAFQILQSTPSSILRPTSVREVAITVGDIFKSGKIPDNYALELSPGLIFGKSLKAYTENPFLYRTRISIATKTLENSTKQIGSGIRFTLWDETDLRTDGNLLKELIKIGDESNDMMDACVEEILGEGIDQDDPNFEKLVNECLEKKDFDKIGTMIEKKREEVKKKNWNAIIIEAGLALAATSNDSLMKDLKVQNYQWWFAGAFPLGEGGQLLIGLNGGVSANESGELKNARSNFGLRGYYGTNGQKIFLEGNLRTSSDFMPEISWNLGYEYNLMNGLWADISLGMIKKEGQDFTTSSSINFRFATPE